MLQVKSLHECGDLMPHYVELIDAVFLAEKSRSGSITSRFPRVFREQNRSGLYVALLDNSVVGSVATSDLTVQRIGCSVQVKMLGLVGVRREYRGRGVGGVLLRSVTKFLRERSDLSVLWTTIPQFYATEGWSSFDEGVVGTWRRSGPCGTVLQAERPWHRVCSIEEIRREYLVELTVRSAEDYRTVPPAVDDVWCLLAGDGKKLQAYALVGERGDTGIVYELVGDRQYFGELWGRVQQRFSCVYVNDLRGSSSYQWFVENAEVEWRRQDLGMWLGCDVAQLSRCPPPHVPFFDRI